MRSPFLPLVVTISIVVWVAGFVQKFVGPTTTVGRLVGNLGWRYSPEDRTFAYVIGWIIVLALVFLLGVAVEMGAKRLAAGSDRCRSSPAFPWWAASTTPPSNWCRCSIGRDQADLQGMSVVYCVFGGDRGTAFLALLVSPQSYYRRRAGMQDRHHPHGTCSLWRRAVVCAGRLRLDADMSVDGLMSIYVSMGVTAPQFMQNAMKLPNTSSPMSSGTRDDGAKWQHRQRRDRAIAVTVTVPLRHCSRPEACRAAVHRLSVNSRRRSLR